MNPTYVLIFVCTLIVEIVTILGTIILIEPNPQLSLEAVGKNSTGSQNPENILCRSCGSQTSSANFIISKLSPSSHYAFKDTLFNREMVLVQVVSQYHFSIPCNNYNSIYMPRFWGAIDSLVQFPADF